MGIPEDLLNPLSPDERLALLTKAGCVSDYILWVREVDGGRYLAYEVETGIGAMGDTAAEATANYFAGKTS